MTVSGLWRSMAARVTGGHEVAGSNPASPTKTQALKPLLWQGFRRVWGRVLDRAGCAPSGFLECFLGRAMRSGVLVCSWLRRMSKPESLMLSVGCRSGGHESDVVSSDEWFRKIGYPGCGQGVVITWWFMNAFGCRHISGFWNRWRSTAASRSVLRWPVAGSGGRPVTGQPPMGHPRFPAHVGPCGSHRQCRFLWL
jgi:hypothetical protein